MKNTGRKAVWVENHCFRSKPFSLLFAGTNAYYAKIVVHFEMSDYLKFITIAFNFSGKHFRMICLFEMFSEIEKNI